MSRIVPLVMIAALAGCTAAPPGPPQPVQLDAKAQSRMAQLLSDKAPGRPSSCLPNWRTREMTVISDDTIIFRESPGRVWVQKPRNACNLLAAGPYALVTRSSTGSLCSGDIATVVDTMSGTTVGSCVMGDFVPYTRVVR